ncbi:MAG: ATP-binding protein, partial [Actinomycetes bacterium]
VMVPLRTDLTGATPALIFVLPVLVSAIFGGRFAAVVTAVGAALAYNLAFVAPHGSVAVPFADDAITVGVLVAVGLVTGTVVTREAERRQTAEERATALAVLNDEYELVQHERERLLEEATRLAVLEQVDAQRAALLRSVSHDLRTPLAAIRAVASDLRAEAGYDAETRDDLLDLVLEEAERLDRIVGNLLSMSRIEAGALSPDTQAVALDELVTSCVRRLDRIFREVRVEVTFPPDLPLADADYSQLDQVTSNLLENAARYAPPKSVVRIGGRPLPPDRVQLTVEDEGPGIPPHERERAFAAFARGPGSTGSGVGLAICRAIVEAHGGWIVIEDGRGGGARFVVTLPVHR